MQLLNLTKSAAIELVTGGSVAGAALVAELNDLSISKFFEFNIDDFLVNLFDEIIHDDSEDNTTTEDVAFEDTTEESDTADGERGNNTISLPEYDGTTTHGVLVLDDGTQIRFASGNGDPRYTNYRNNGHVEQKAALYMRENNISNAVVYHNNTNGTCGYCNTMTATFLPKGATLTVVPPKNAVANNSRAIDYVKTYTGTSNDPKISPQYKGN